MRSIRWLFHRTGRPSRSGSEDATIKLWNVETGAEVRKMSVGWYVYSVAFSPDGKLLASGSEDGGLRLWNAATGSLVRMLLPAVTRPDDAEKSIAFSGDGKKIAVQVAVGSVKVLDTENGKLIRTFHSGLGAGAVAFSPDGSMVAAASATRHRTVLYPD